VLINDLDLIVTDPAGATIPINSLNPGEKDDVNNVEQVRFRNNGSADLVGDGNPAAGPRAHPLGPGVYRVKVQGADILSNQPYSLVASGPFVMNQKLFPAHAPRLGQSTTTISNAATSYKAIVANCCDGKIDGATMTANGQPVQVTVGTVTPTTGTQCTVDLGITIPQGAVGPLLLDVASCGGFVSDETQIGVVVAQGGSTEGEGDEPPKAKIPVDIKPKAGPPPALNVPDPNAAGKALEPQKSIGSGGNFVDAYRKYWVAAPGQAPLQSCSGGLVRQSGTCEPDAANAGSFKRYACWYDPQSSNKVWRTQETTCTSADCSMSSCRMWSDVQQTIVAEMCMSKAGELLAQICRGSSKDAAASASPAMVVTMALALLSLVALRF
jgi:hypothetical protein